MKNLFPGKFKGTCALIEKKLSKKLLYFPCRHHIHELMLSGVFGSLEGLTSGPENNVFKRFQQHWPKLNAADFDNCNNNSYVMDVVRDSRQDILFFCKSQISVNKIAYFALQCEVNNIIFQMSKDRKDYKELLELIILFLDGDDQRTIKFKYPGAMHRARWMSKAIYCLKIWMFRKQFVLKTEEEKMIRYVSLFVVMVYAKYWFVSSIPTSAPYNDLQLIFSLDRLVKYSFK